jgi:hypothetical protein
MPDRVVIKVMRVGAGQTESHPVVLGGIVSDVTPADGYIITTNGPGQIPLYVRDSDIQRALEAYLSKGRSISIKAESWDDAEGEKNE